MANARGKAIDNTHLSIDQAEERGFIHRDYIAHCLRWTHVAKYLAQGGRYKTARVLDIGCGVDIPLARMLYSSRYIVEEYVGVDYNNPGKFKMEPFHTGKMIVSAFGHVDAAEDLKIGDAEYVVADTAHKLPNVITMFEVFEHIEPEHGRRMLALIRQLLRATPGATAFISTPCYDSSVGAADNHVSEPTYAALGALLEDMGFEIVGNWGTFASQRDYKHLLSDYCLEAAFSKLSEYYDSNYVATIFAPLFPAQSRNCLWQLRHSDGTFTRKFPALREVPGPWTSSEKWEQLDG